MEAPKKRFLQRFIGDKAFYGSVVKLLLPILVQVGITNLVNLLDNVMVGGLGTASISGVAIVNQLIFVFNLTIFGGLSGASIFGAQYAGVKDHEGVRYTFRFKLMLGLVVTAAAILVLTMYGEPLIALYLNEDGGGSAALELTMSEAKSYLVISLFGLFPFMLTQVFGSTLRETGETKTPMIASIASILVNLVLNWVLIYGKLGSPALGVRGAAIATVVSRYVEAAYLIIVTYANKEKHQFILGALKSMYIPGGVVKKICVTGTPLLLNELLWSVGVAIINQCYSVRGLNAVAAVNITTTVWQLFSIIMYSMGTAISIMVGQILGTGDTEGARDVDTKLIALSFALHMVIGALAVALSGVIPLIYNTEPEVRALTSSMLIVAGCSLPLNALAHASYFTVRSGGRTLLTMLFDSVFTWVIPLPLAFITANFTDLSVVTIFAIVQFSNIIKFLIAFPILKSGSWARRVIV